MNELLERAGNAIAYLFCMSLMIGGGAAVLAVAVWAWRRALVCN